MLAAIQSREQRVNADTVGVLEQLLAQAKAGEIATVFVVAFAPDGPWRTRFSASMDSLHKIGALEALKLDYLRSLER